MEEGFGCKSDDPYWTADDRHHDQASTLADSCSQQDEHDQHSLAPHHAVDDSGSSQDDSRNNENKSGNNEDESGNSQDEYGHSEDESGHSEDESGNSQNESGNNQDESGHSQDESGNSQNESGNSQDEFGNSQDESENSQDEFGNSQDESGNSQDESESSQNERDNNSDDAVSSQDETNSQDEAEGSQDESENSQDEYENSQDEADSQNKSENSQDETGNSQDECGNSQDEGNKSSDEETNSQDEYENSQDQADESEDEAENSQDEVEESQDELGNSLDEAEESEDETRISEGETENSQDEVEEREDEARNSPGQTGDSDNEAENSENEAENGPDEAENSPENSSDDAEHSPDDAEENPDEAEQNQDETENSPDEAKNSADEAEASQEKEKRHDEGEQDEGEDNRQDEGDESGDESGHSQDEAESSEGEVSDAQSDVCDAILRRAEARDWLGVFNPLGCFPTLTEGDVDDDDFWDAIVDAVRFDFWQDPVPFCTSLEDRNDFDAKKAKDVIKRGVFPSLQIELVDMGVKLDMAREKRLIEYAFRDSDWPTITLLYFIFCAKAHISPALSVVVEKAIGVRDWRYVDALAVDFKKFHFLSSREFLVILGVEECVEDRQARNTAVRALLAGDKWDPVVLEIVFKTLVALTIEINRDDMKYWTMALEFLEDFQCETSINRHFLMKCLKFGWPSAEEMEGFVNYALDNNKNYILRGIADGVLLSPSQVPKAIDVSARSKDWKMVIKWLSFYEGFCDHAVDREPVLFLVIRQNNFVLKPHMLPPNVDLTHEGFTLLHRAVGCWQASSNANTIQNITCLLDHKADVNILDPNGLTVMQKIMDVSGDKPGQGDMQRTQLIVYAANSSMMLDHVINWTPVPGSEWSALHVLCHYGDFNHIHHLIKLGVSPFLLRQGLTVLHTAVFSDKHSISEKLRVCKTLIRVPGLVKFHVEVVSRAAEDTSDKRLPLLHLVEMSKTHKVYFKLIKTLHEHGVFAGLEFQEATSESIVKSLRELDLDDVMDFLQQQLALNNDDQNKQLEPSQQ